MNLYKPLISSVVLDESCFLSNLNFTRSFTISKIYFGIVCCISKASAKEPSVFILLTGRLTMYNYSKFTNERGDL